MPVDIALGKVHLAEIYGNGGQLTTWYDILNCGFMMHATAGPDWNIKDSPRVYVDLGDEPFTLDNWRKGLTKGRSFITTGPMLFFTVNQEPPGSIINIKNGPKSFEIDAEALVPDGHIPVEIVFNGKVIRTTNETKTMVTLDDSGWIAVRCEGAHSNPIYINFEGRPAGHVEPAQKFIKIIDRLAEWVENKGLFDDESQKQALLEVIAQGRDVYRSIIEEVSILERN
jgi:hypothetical protein